MSGEFHSLRVAAVSNPIKDATTITFVVPDHLRETFLHHPGQHLIIRFQIDGQEVRRSYSLNSCPFVEEPIQVTVKRVEGGLVSNYVNDHLKAGDALDVMVPQGRFYAEIDEEAYKTYFLFAAGSGITPIISIARSVLVASPNSAVNLFYGNAHQDSIIFQSELDELAATYPDRFRVVHTLSSPKVWTSWTQWKGRKGRIDAGAVEWFIAEHPPVAQNTEYYICGPGAMNTTVRSTLIGLGIPQELVHIEQFGGKVEGANDQLCGVDGARLSVRLNGQSRELVVAPEQTLLQAMKAEGIEAPYSCESGVCGTCVARLSSGKTEMKANMALDDKEVAKGQVLTCQAVCQSERVVIEF